MRCQRKFWLRRLWQGTPFRYNERVMLIVIEGTDGSGKETQAQLLVEYLQKKGVPTLYLDFPQYDSFYGAVIAKYLRGEFGDVKSTSPYLVSLVYALDRTTRREEIVSFANSGGVMVANRYVPSNIAHQAANISDPTARAQFITWIQELEYTQLHIPKEDLVIYLDLPWEVAMKKSEEKLERGTGHDYLKGKADIHEIDREHRQQTARIYQTLVETNSHWRSVSCIDEHGTQRRPEEIHQSIVAIVSVEMDKKRS